MDHQGHPMIRSETNILRAAPRWSRRRVRTTKWSRKNKRFQAAIHSKNRSSTRAANRHPSVERAQASNMPSAKSEKGQISQRGQSSEEAIVRNSAYIHSSRCENNRRGSLSEMHGRTSIARAIARDVNRRHSTMQVCYGAISPTQKSTVATRHNSIPNSVACTVESNLFQLGTRRLSISKALLTPRIPCERFQWRM